jgi:hypothetical protein
MRKFALETKLLALGLFLFFLLPPTDPDLGWQLRYGQEIWQTHAIPRTNEYSVLLAGYRWPDHSWLYQAVLYPLWSAFGLWGLTFANAVLMTAAFLLFYWSIRNFAVEKFLLILITLYFGAGVFSFGLRSQLVGFFFFNLLLSLLARIDRRSRLRYFVPVVMLFWANSHGSVVLGVPLLLLLPAFWRRVPAVILIVSVAATLINPFGWAIYSEAWRHLFGGIDLSTVIAEWVPPVPLVWWLVALSAAGLIFLLAREFLSSAILTAIFAFLALKARRNVPLYLLVGGYSLLTAGNRGIGRSSADELLWAIPGNSFRRTRLRVKAAVMAAAVLLLFYSLLVRLAANSGGQQFLGKFLPRLVPGGAVRRGRVSKIAKRAGQHL